MESTRRSECEVLCGVNVKNKGKEKERECGVDGENKGKGKKRVHS